MLWLLGVGAIFTLRVKNSADMFTAGGSSPWWISGLSGFITIFSAGTFAVWGGIAYRLGIVAVSLLMATGLSALLVGFTVAARWRQMGISTPTEFLRLRFNETAVQVYTWLGFIFRGLGMSVGLYALAVTLSALVSLPEGAPFRDAETGKLAIDWSIVLWGTVVVLYTMSGGLWAVLMTDVIQFLVLFLLILVAAPLSIEAIGGIDRLWAEAPSDFFSPANAEYTYRFLFLWFWLGFFRYAADWAFVQRYICVPTPRDARKAALLMGGLYVVSPIIWMLPAMAWRIQQPIPADADPDQVRLMAESAYALACEAVLPAGMIGVMVAAMFSATASTVSSLLNVFAGVFTYDVYRQHLNPSASERRLVVVGRLATLAYGGIVIGLAICIPALGGAEAVILSLVTSLMGPLMIPVVWGLYSRSISHWAIWTTLIVCGVANLVAALVDLPINPRFADALIGLVLPLLIMLLMETWSRRHGVDPGWLRIEKALAGFTAKPVHAASSRLPRQIVALSLGMLGITMFVIALSATQQRTTIFVFSAMLLAASAILAYKGFNRSDQ